MRAQVLDRLPATFAGSWTASTDYVRTRGYDEGRVQVINPQIRSVCDPAFPDPRQSTRAASPAPDPLLRCGVRRGGLGAGRLSQINMIGTTNESKFDSWTTTLRRRTAGARCCRSATCWRTRAPGAASRPRPTAATASRSRPTISSSTREWGPTRWTNGTASSGAASSMPYGFQVSPIVQFASARPYTPILGFDVNGDGQTNIVDRLCEGVSVQSGVRGPRRRHGNPCAQPERMSAGAG